MPLKLDQSEFGKAFKKLLKLEPKNPNKKKKKKDKTIDVNR